MAKLVLEPAVELEDSELSRWLTEEDGIVVRLRLRESRPELASISVVFSARFG